MSRCCPGPLDLLVVLRAPLHAFLNVMHKTSYSSNYFVNVKRARYIQKDYALADHLDCFWLREEKPHTLLKKEADNKSHDPKDIYSIFLVY